MSDIPLSRRQIAALKALPAERPIVMLNLLRFRDHAHYDDHTDHADAPTPCSGSEAYRRYSLTAVKTIGIVGGSILFGGSAGESLIAPAGERWHQVVLVRYPSVAAFLRMMALPEYQAAVHHRTAALEDSRLIPILAPEAETLQG